MKILNRYIHFRKMTNKTFVTYYYVDAVETPQTDGQVWLLTQDMLGDADKDFLGKVATAPIKELWVKNWNYIIIPWGDKRNYSCFIRECLDRNRELYKRVEQGLAELIEKGE